MTNYRIAKVFALATVIGLAGSCKGIEIHKHQSDYKGSRTEKASPLGEYARNNTGGLISRDDRGDYLSLNVAKGTDQVKVEYTNRGQKQMHVFNVSDLQLTNGVAGVHLSDLGVVSQVDLDSVTVGFYGTDRSKVRPKQAERDAPTPQPAGPKEPINKAAEDVPGNIGQIFNYQKGNLSYKNDTLEENKEYIKRRINLSTLGISEDKQIVFDYYDVKGEKKTPAILIMPILGGSSYDIEEHFAKHFAGKGYSSVIVHRDKLSKMKKDLNQVYQLNEMLEQTVIDHKKVIDWIELQKDLDLERIGAFGISMGGIKGALLMPMEPRIKAGVLGLAGGDMPYILMNSKEKGIVEIRDKLLSGWNLSREDLEGILRKEITCDPLAFAKYLNPDNVLMVLAANDDIVPYSKGQELRKAMGNPRTIVLPTGHYTAILYVPHIKGAAFDFFEEKFKEKSSKGRNLTGK